MTRIEQYFQALKNKNTSFDPSGLCGRVIRGKKPEDFLTLSDDPDRKLVMLMGSDGLKKLLGKTGYEILIDIGYESDYIVRKVNEGNQFKLFVTEEGTDALLATWNNVVEIVGDIYPDTKDIFKASLHDLKTYTFDYYESITKKDWSEIDKVGKIDPDFITYEAFKNSAGGSSSVNAVLIRMFLYFTVHLRELFSGDGYTYDDKGNRGLLEYIAENKTISSFANKGLFDFKVDLNGGNVMEKINNKAQILGIDEIESKNTAVDDLGTENVNLIFIGVDCSGSMDCYVSDMGKELTDFKDAILNSKEADEILLARANFNDRVDICGYKKVDDFEVNYSAGGNTKLYDTIVIGGNELENYIENYLKKQGMRVKAVFAVFSDGDDTASLKSFQDAKAVIEMLNKKEIVTAFICFGTADTMAKYLGFKNILRLGSSKSDLRRAFSCLSKSVIQNSKSVLNKTADFFDVT
jgi:hypothetical protein